MFDIGTFCRTCMCQVLGDNEVSLKSYRILESLGLAEKLDQCCNIKVNPCDGYPSIVCEICYVKISDFYEFQQMCQHSLRKFNDLRTEHKSKMQLDIVIAEIPIERVGEDVGIEDNQTVVKSMGTPENDHDNDKLFELKDTVELVEEVKIERFYLEPVASSNEREQLSVAGTFDKNVSELIMGKTAMCCESVEEKCSTPHEDSENASDAMFLYQENSEHLTDGEVVENSESSYEEEGEKVYASKRLKCSLCPKKFLQKHCLEGHMRTHQGLLEHPCPRENCVRSYRRLFDLKQHLRAHDGLPREYRCVRGGCNRVYNHYRDLLSHRVEKHGALSIFKCDEEGCGKEFKTRTYLKRHKDTRHSDGLQKQPESHMCDTCGAILRSLATLRTHSLIHVDRSQWPFACNEGKCSKRFRTHQQLRIHKNRHAGIKNYHCPHCDMRFVTSTNLKNHINTHTWERTWNCEFCPKIFNTPDLLRKHVENKHGIIKRYPCSICNRNFNTSNAKMYHEMTHVGDEQELTPAEVKDHRHPCNYCDRAFDSPSRKKLHEMIHTGEKPHICDECGKKFRTAIQVKTHKRTHMKERPRDHVCSVCDRAFFSAQSMKHHKMKHTKEKPYKCEVCGISFRWPNNLTRHRKLHSRDKNVSENSQEEECMEILMEVE